MKLSLKKWHEYYDRVKFLGQLLKESYPTVDKNKKYIEPIAPLSIDSQKILKQEIKEILDECTLYLDACNVKPPIRLWKYDTKDPSTWVSDESFRFKHLLKPGVRRCTIGYRP